MTNITQNTHPAVNDRIETEAASWVAQLDSERMSDADRLALREWASRSPRHMSELKRLAMLWGDIDHQLDSVLCKADGGSFASLLLGWFRLRPINLIGAAGAFVACMALLVTLTLNGFSSDASKSIYHTEVGQSRLITLEDTSTIHINTDSMVEVEYDSDARIVRLLRGEAVFSVAKDKNRPFRVYARSGLVEAIGTAFIVRLSEQDVNVTVSEGTVRVDAFKSPLPNVPVEQRVVPETVNSKVVEAGQYVRVETSVSDIEDITFEQIDRKVSWQQGMLVFQGDTLEYVLDEVSRYTSMDVVISDPDLRHMRMGGVFKTGEVEPLFHALETSMGIEIERVRPNLVYLKRPAKI